MSDPRSVYDTRLTARRATQALWDRRYVLLGNLRAVVVIAALAMAWAAFEWRMLSGWWLAAPIGVYVVLAVALARADGRRRQAARAIAWYVRAIERLEGRWRGRGENGDRLVDPAHLSAGDLDILGAGSLFQLLCQARTRMGEEMLAAWLLAPAAADVVRARQAAVEELAPRLDLREDIAAIGDDEHVSVRPQALAAWGEGAPALVSPALRIATVLMSLIGVAAVASLVGYVLSLVGVWVIADRTVIALRVFVSVSFLVFGLVHWRLKKTTDRIIHEGEQAARDLDVLAPLLARIERERFHAPRLAALRTALDVHGAPASRRIAKLDTLVEWHDRQHHFLVKLVGLLLMWDLHLAYAFEAWRRASGRAVRQWLDAVAEIEALLSIAGYRYERPGDVWPEVADGPPGIEADALAHPLIDGGRATVAVPNDIRLTGDLHVLVVSGSNMSGKSTLLRTLGINAVLAQAGAPVRARRMRLSPLTVAASIHVQDSLEDGTSRFYAEILRIRQIMDAARDRPPVLFLIDEILHGTNSHDRRIGAEAIVRGLVARGAIGLVTTHDLALTQTAVALGARAANVHFEDTLEDGRLHFDYRMRPGVVEHSNAIALMRAVGLDVGSDQDVTAV